MWSAVPFDEFEFSRIINFFDKFDSDNYDDEGNERKYCNNY